MNRILTLGRDARTILRHRLAVPDCIAEALAEEHSEEAVLRACVELDNELRGGKAMTVVDDLELDVLTDAADGSTFFGNCEEWTPAEARRWNRAADEIERVLSTAYDDTVRVPRL